MNLAKSADAAQRCPAPGGRQTATILSLRSLATLIVALGLVLAPLSPSFGAPSQAAQPGATTVPAAAAVTRGEVVKIVRHEIQRAFKLRNWHRYSSYIDEYKGADADSLFALSTLDHATAIGNPEAAVRVIAYADYECPYCKRFENQTSATLHKRFNSDALFLFRFFPLGIHGEIARTEAIAGACIARIAGPEAFRRFTSEMFASTGGQKTDRKKRLATLSEAVLRDSKVDLDQKTLKQYYKNCTTGKTGAALIASDASFKGVTGTPTIFVVDTSRHQAWRLAGALPTWVFEAMIHNVMAGRAGNSDWAVEQGAVQVPDM